MSQQPAPINQQHIWNKLTQEEQQRLLALLERWIIKYTQTEQKIKQPLLPPEGGCHEQSR